QVGALLDDYSLEVWGWTDREPKARWTGTIYQPPACEFHPDGSSVAVFAPGKGVFLRRGDGNEQSLLQFTNGRALYLRFDPSGDRLGVVAEPDGVKVLSCTGKTAVVWTQPMSKPVPWLDWSPDGRRLIAG